jgi:hypothetical protein
MKCQPTLSLLSLVVFLILKNTSFPSVETILMLRVLSLALVGDGWDGEGGFERCQVERGEGGGGSCETYRRSWAFARPV